MGPVHDRHATPGGAPPVLLGELRPRGGPPWGLRRRHPGDTLRRCPLPHEINIHFPQSANVAAEIDSLVSIPEQIVTGQSSTPVVKLIQDAVVVSFWLTDLQRHTHCPIELSRSVFEQMAADIPHFETFGDLRLRQAEIATAWSAFQRSEPDHPTVRAMAAAGMDYTRSGFAMLSLCLPSDCHFTGKVSASSGPGGRLALAWHRLRGIPSSSSTVVIRNGLFLQGWVNTTVLTGRGGILLHIYLYHGRLAALAFLDALQRFTTCASIYQYNHSVGLDDCLLPEGVRRSARRILETQVNQRSVCRAHG